MNEYKTIIDNMLIRIFIANFLKMRFWKIILSQQENNEFIVN